MAAQPMLSVKKQPRGISSLSRWDNLANLEFPNGNRPKTRASACCTKNN